MPHMSSYFREGLTSYLQKVGTWSCWSFLLHGSVFGWGVREDVLATKGTSEALLEAAFPHGPDVRTVRGAHFGSLQGHTH